MSSQPNEPTAPPPDGGGDGSRLHIRAITEMPAGHDEELATIFREMRRAADIPAEQIAGRLATSLETIEALENGALFALPEWPELSRIVTAYATQLGLDSRPILRRLEGQLGANPSAAAAPAPAATASAAPSGPPMPPSASAPRTAARPPPGRSPLPQPPGAAPPSPGAAPPPPPRPGPQPRQQPRSRPPPPPQPQPRPQPYAGEAVPEPEKKTRGRVALFMRSLFSWAILIGFVAALGSGVWYAAKHPRMVWSALDTLPEPIPRIMRSTWNFMRPLENKPARPQISDPDNRKSDKLP